MSSSNTNQNFWVKAHFTKLCESRFLDIHPFRQKFFTDLLKNSRNVEQTNPNIVFRQHIIFFSLSLRSISTLLVHRRLGHSLFIHKLIFQSLFIPSTLKSLFLIISHILLSYHRNPLLITDQFSKWILKYPVYIKLPWIGLVSQVFADNISKSVTRCFY